MSTDPTMSGAADLALPSQRRLEPAAQAARSTVTWLGGPAEDIGTDNLVLELAEEAAKISAGDFSRPEAMLTCQAHVLDAVFADLVTRARTHEDLKMFDVLLRLALKAQSQCRNTLETLAEIKFPRAATVIRQQNIASTQQVNNHRGRGTPRERARALDPNSYGRELLQSDHRYGD